MRYGYVRVLARVACTVRAARAQSSCVALFWTRVNTVWRWRVLMRSVSLVFFAIIASGTMWFWTEETRRLTTRLQTAILLLSVKMGFYLNHIEIIDCVYTPLEHIWAALYIRRGDSIFALNTNFSKQRLEALPWVKSAIVERRLPDMLRLTLVERQGAVLWEQNGQHVLLDTEGAVIVDDVTPFRNLLVVSGEKAPSHLGGLLLLIYDKKNIELPIRSAQFVSGRRWNLQLRARKHDTNVLLLLPEENPAEALQRLSLLNKEHGILRYNLEIVDLRTDDRLVMRPYRLHE